MSLKQILLIGTFCIFSSILQAQILEIKEKEPITSSGIEYGFLIRNEQTKSVSKEEYSRFEITLYATNKSGCTKLYSDRVIGTSQNNIIANFLCTNANGKRLTSKSGEIVSPVFNVVVKVQDKNQEVKAGYIFRNNQTIRNNIIVLVPKGERPMVECTVNSLQEL